MILDHTIDSKKCIIYFHGGFDYPDIFNTLVLEFGKDYSVFAPILPGHPQGPAIEDSADFESYVEKIKLYIKDFFTYYEEVNLIGFSLGGMVVSKILCDPQLKTHKAVVICSPFYENHSTSKSLIKGLTKDQFSEVYFKNPLFGVKWALKHAFGQTKVFINHKTTNALIQVIKSYRPSHKELLNKKLLVVLGEKDSLFSTADSSKVFEGSSGVRVLRKDGGHFWWLLKEEELVKDIRAFFDS